MTLRILIRFTVLVSLLFGVAACGGKQTSDEDLMNTEERRKARVGKLFGEDAFAYGPGVKRDKDEGGGGGGIAVNGYLWRASLDTMSFMPLNSADPFGGVIITDWYVPPESPRERMKVQIYILDRQLRADGLRVTVFRQVQGGDGLWVDAPVQPQTAAELENAILTRARQLRIDAGGGV